MSLRRNIFLGLLLQTSIAVALGGCGQTNRAELPDTSAPIKTILTAEEAKAAADALVRASAERQAQYTAAAHSDERGTTH